MNKHVLMTIDSMKNPGKYSTEELKKNAKDANAAAAYAAADAFAAATTAYAAAYASADATERWLDKYFKLSGENRADYEEALLSEFKGTI